MSVPKARTDKAKPPGVETRPPAELRDHLALIADMTREFGAANDYKAVAHTALERIAKYVGAEAASLFLLSDLGDSLVCTACFCPVDITGLSIPATAGIVGCCVVSRKGLLVRDVSQDTDFLHLHPGLAGCLANARIKGPLEIY